MSDAAPIPAPSFDAVAASYDTTFTDTRLGRILRARVWDELDRVLGPGDRVLDIGCGTGEDAVHLAGRGVAVTAVDPSPRMLAVARGKAADRGVAGAIDLIRGGIDQVPDGAVFDGAVADFGALNCVADRGRFAAELARLVRPGGRVVLVVMGPVCAWEILWHLALGRPRTAVRRLRRGSTARLGDAVVPVSYPTPGAVRRDLQPWFAPAGVRGLGTFLPPSYLAGPLQSRPRVLARLARLDRAVSTAWWAPWVADHHLSRFVRR